MIGFAIAIVIVAAMLFSMGRDGFTNSVYNMKRRYANNVKDGFIAMHAPTPEELEKAKSNTDYSDVVEEVSFIFGIPKTARDIEWLCKCANCYALDKRNVLDWRQAVKMIRLAKIGKIGQGYTENHGMTALNPEIEEKVKRYFKVLCDSLRKNGIETHIVKYHWLYDNQYNLDQLAETRDGLTVVY